MNVFVVSDTHFGHHNVVRYCHRPFKSASHMDAELIRRWNSRVTEEDTVYFLGDFAFVKQGRLLEILDQLAFCKLVVVPGNHDKEILKMWNHSRNMFPANVVVGDAIQELIYDHQHFVFCHYPMDDWDQKHRGSVHLHGHSHTQWSEGFVPIVKNRYDIGVDMYGGPVQLTGDCRYLKEPMGWE